MTLNISIFEDQQIFADSLTMLIKKWSEKFKICTDIKYYNDGSQISENIINTSDIIFMDIEMNQMDGMSASKIIRSFNKNVPIVFVTNYKHFVFDGYKVDAFRYLLKPIKQTDCFDCMEKAKNYHLAKKDEYLVVKQKDGVIRVLINSIIYIEAQQHYCKIVCEKETHNFLIRFSEIKNSLHSSCLLQCHRSYIVNCEHIHSVKKGYIMLDNGEEIRISRTYVSEILEKIAKLMEE